MSITNNQNKKKDKRKTAGDKNEIDEEAPIMQKKIEKRKKSDGKVVSDKNEKKKKREVQIALPSHRWRQRRRHYCPLRWNLQLKHFIMAATMGRVR